MEPILLIMRVRCCVISYDKEYNKRYYKKNTYLTNIEYITAVRNEATFYINTNKQIYITGKGC